MMKHTTSVLGGAAAGCLVVVALTKLLQQQRNNTPDVVHVRLAPGAEADAVALRVDCIKWVAPCLSAPSERLFVCAKPNGCDAHQAVTDKFVVERGDRSFGRLRSRFDLLECRG